jgi:hypothetical protein
VNSPGVTIAFKDGAFSKSDLDQYAAAIEAPEQNGKGILSDLRANGFHTYSADVTVSAIWGYIDCDAPDDCAAALTKVASTAGVERATNELYNPPPVADADTASDNAAAAVLHGGALGGFQSSTHIARAAMVVLTAEAASAHADELSRLGASQGLPIIAHLVAAGVRVTDALSQTGAIQGYLDCLTRDDCDADLGAIKNVMGVDSASFEQLAPRESHAAPIQH